MHISEQQGVVPDFQVSVFELVISKVVGRVILS